MKQDEFVRRAFIVASAMTNEPTWAIHVIAVDDQYIRLKNGKNVSAACLERMYPYLLEVDLVASSANPIIMRATKGQGCVNVPMREIARRIRNGTGSIPRFGVLTGEQSCSYFGSKVPSVS